MVDKQERYKIIIVGDSKVGKTTLKNEYLGLEYIDKYSMTLGVDIGVKMLEKRLLHIFDIGGQQIYETVDEFFENAHGAVIVFDITDYDSFENIDRWINVISTRVGHMVPSVLVGNKSDLRNYVETEVSVEEATEKSKKLSQNSIYEIPYFETSAKTGLNVDHLFQFLIGAMRSYYGALEKTPRSQ